MDNPESIGDYTIESRIDRSGKAQVFKAVGPGGQTVALKLYPEEESDAVRERRLEALQNARELNHPALCRTIDSGETEGRVFGVFEFVQGTSLQKVISHRKLPFATCLRVLRKAAEGLEQVVRAGHDPDGISPASILVQGDGRAVKILEPCMPMTFAGDSGSTATMHGLDALRYMAPERMAGQADSEGTAVVYSLGVIGYEMLTGSPPVGQFKLPSAADGDVPPDIDPIILKCLSTTPADRYPSPGRVAQALTHLEARHGAGAGVALARRAARLAGSERNLWLLLAAAGLLIVVLVALLLLG